jgi:hypothetical protein
LHLYIAPSKAHISSKPFVGRAQWENRRSIFYKKEGSQIDHCSKENFDILLFYLLLPSYSDFFSYFAKTIVIIFSCKSVAISAKE